MNPLLIAGGAVAAFFGYKMYTKKEYQSHTTTSPTGVPVTVLTPVSGGVTPSQALATLNPVVATAAGSTSPSIAAVRLTAIARPPTASAAAHAAPRPRHARLGHDSR